MKISDRTRLTAAALTVLFHALLLVLMLTLFLRYNSAEQPPREWPPADSAEILFGGEYVMAGDIAEPGHEAAPTPAPRPEPVTEASPKTETVNPDPAPEPLLTSKQPSVAKAKPDARPKTDTKAAEEAEQRRKAEQERQQRETAANINSRVAFGSSSGQSGQPDGNATEGAVSGVVAQGLGNRGVESLPKPARGPMGQIVISIKVNRAGAVTSASYLRGSGAAAASQKARSECVAAAKRARFAAAPDGPESQSGSLTYNYK